MKKRLVTIILAVVAVLLPQSVRGQEAYAALTENETVLESTPTGITYGKTLTFYYDDLKGQRGGMDLGPFTSESERGWSNNSSDITTIVFDASMANYTGVTSIAYWFYGLTNLTTVTGAENLNTTNVTSMRSTFGSCSSLTSLDLSRWNTENVTNMHMAFMGCTALTSLNLVGWNTAKATDTYSFLEGCSSLTEINLSTFNTAAVTDMRQMFYNCAALRTIYVSSSWSTAGLPSNSFGGNMFVGDTNLVGGAGTTYDSSNTGVAYARIDGGPDSQTPGYFTAAPNPVAYARLSQDNSGATVLTFYYDGYMNDGDFGVEPFRDSTVRDWNDAAPNITSVVFDASFANYSPTSTAYWFQGMSTLTSIEGLQNLNTQNVTSMNCMFFGCSSLTSVDLSGFNTENVTDMGFMFSGCSGLTSLDISNFNTQNVTNMNSMFSECSSLNSLDVTVLDTQNVTGMNGMFNGCSNITRLDVSGFNTTNVTDMSQMFGDCTGLTSLDLSGFNTANVTNMSNMFYACRSLTSIDVSDFNTANVTNMSGMFNNCFSLTELNLSSFNTANVEYMMHMFAGCSNLQTILVGNDFVVKELDGNLVIGGQTSDITDRGFEMFGTCTNLRGGAGTTYSADHTGSEYARIDGGPNSQTPGYFTDANATTPEAYAVLSDNNTVLTFYYDDQKQIRGGMSVGPFTDTDQREWYNDTNSITTAVFDESFANCTTLTSTAYWFSSCVNLTSITGIGNLKTDNVEDMSWMFFGTKLSTIDVSGFNTENVTNMQAMFSNIEGVENLDLSGFNTSKVTDMSYMFRSYPHSTIYVGSGWSTANVQNSIWMFWDCTNLVGGAGTTYSADHVDAEYARIDGGPNSQTPGYFTDANASVDNGLEIFTIDANTTYTPNEPITATPSVVMTPGNDTAWNTYATFGFNNSQGVDFDASIYYPGRTETQTFTACIGGTDNPVDDSNTKYEAQNKNLPTTGGYYIFETKKNGSLIIPVSIGPSKPLFVTDESGNINTDIQVKGTNGGIHEMVTSPLCSFNEIDPINGFISLNVKQGQKYYVFCTGSKMICGGYVFSTDTISIDPGTMHYIKDYLERSATSDAEPYAVLTDNETVISETANGPQYGKTLTFYYDNMKEQRGGASIEQYDYYSKENRPWSPYTSLITTAVFDPSFDQCTNLTSTAFWFTFMDHLETIENIEYLHTDNVEDMNCMFDSCYVLRDLDVSHFVTSKVRNMQCMFNRCEALTSLNLSNFNTSSCTFMRGMFYDCKGLTSLDITNFDTSQNTSTESMFELCSGLTALDLSHFSTESVTDMSSMFRGCERLESLDLSNFNTSRATEMDFMISQCTGLTTINFGENFNTANVTTLRGMLYGNASLQQVNLSGFDTGNVTDMVGVFYGCSGLSSLDLSDFNTQNVTNMTYMFNNCSNLREITVTDAWSTAAVTSGNDMFLNCTNLRGGAGTRYSADHVDYTYARIDRLDAPGYFTGMIGINDDEPTFNMYGVLTVNGSMTMEEALAAVGGQETVAGSITAVVWNSSAALTEEDLVGFSNPNMLIYINDGNSQLPANRTNVVVNGTASKVVLTDVAEGNGDFFCPQAFTADSISYSRVFAQRTEPGISRGWEGIALPFDVQTITHEKNGVIAPFGNNASDRHFWLRTFEGGLIRATQIEANFAYIISMPNNETYDSLYIQAGRVTFASQGVTVPETAFHVRDFYTNDGSHIIPSPNYQRQTASEQLYVLNVGTPIDSYAEGSVFVQNLRDVRPFEVFTLHEGNPTTGAPKYLPISTLQSGTTGIEELLPTASNRRTDGRWYDLSGRQLTGKPGSKGVYILNGRKTVVR